MNHIKGNIGPRCQNEGPVEQSCRCIIETPLFWICAYLFQTVIWAYTQGIENLHLIYLDNLVSIASLLLTQKIVLKSVTQLDSKVRWIVMKLKQKIISDRSQ